MLLNIFCFVATYNGAILNQLSNPSWNISKDGIVITQGTLGMEKLWESYGKATNHTRERYLANMEELSVWESYGKAMGNSKISYFYTRFSIHRWKHAMRNPSGFFFCYEKPLQGSFPPWFLGHDNNLNKWTKGASNIFKRFLFWRGPRAIAGTYRAGLACSASSLRHGMLNRNSNSEEEPNSAIFFHGWLDKLEAFVGIRFLKKLWKPQFHVIC